MRGKLGVWSLLAVFALLVAATAASADVKLPSLFADHMVVQREMPIVVWGWADPAEKVTVTLGDQSKTATACEKGKWSVKLDPVKAGGPMTLTVKGKNTITINDVLAGEVWLCSGQSNMAMTVGSSKDFPAEKAAANFPKIRMFTVDRKTAEQPQAECKGDWKICTPDTVGGFSAAGYFFGRELFQKLNVPIGLIHSSWGGTPVQAWTSVATQQAVPKLAPIVEGLEKSIASYDPAKAKENFEKQLAKWKDDEAKAKAAGKQPPRRPNLQQSPNLSPNSAGRLYNAMIAPLVPYTIRGAIWYQGESNAGNAPLYGLQLQSMIDSWRADWKEGDFPFISVQLPNFMGPQQKPSENGGWPLIREQFAKLLAHPNCGMAVTIDVGEERDIHPKDKQNVGRRLACWALNKTYGMQDVAACGPLYKSMTKSDGQIALSFDYECGGLVCKGDKLKGFAIAGADKKFVWADAKIVGNTVVVSSPEVKDPVAVRYAWANNPECNLFSKSGMPAAPFRTDDWNE